MAIFHTESAGCVWKSMIQRLARILDLGPSGPSTNFTTSSNDTNLMRQIDPRHPEPLYSPMYFLGLGRQGRGPASHVCGRDGNPGKGLPAIFVLPCRVSNLTAREMYRSQVAALTYLMLSSVAIHIELRASPQQHFPL